MTEHYREAARGCERIAENLRVRADRLQDRAADRRAKGERLKRKADKLDGAANELRAVAKVKEAEAKDFFAAATILPRVSRKCVGCAMGYVPEGMTYNEIHTCGQTVGGPLRVVNE